MVWYFLLLVAAVGLEQLALYTDKKVYRVIVLGISFLVQSAGLGYFIYYSPHIIISVCLTALTFVKIVSGLRMIAGRMHTEYLRRKLFRSHITLLLAQYIAILSYVYFSKHGITSSALLTAWSLFTLIVGATFFLATLHFLYKSRTKKALQHLSDKELPSISVLIPARNETEDLPGCLRSLLANDYPKLEVLVLDDCSVDGTAELIKDFAHDGVRFISSDASNDIWLPKNRAYQTLYEASSAEILLFAGVDVRFGGDSIRNLVTIMQTHNVDMLSMVPRRVSAYPAHVLFQTIRYFWEFSLPRVFTKRPPTLSTGWLIRKNTLKKVGGFEAARRMIVPEAYISRAVLGIKKKYVLMRSNEYTYIETVKSVQEQHATAIRTRYPQLHRHLELSLFLIVFEFVFMLVPFAMAVYLVASGSASNTFVWIATCALFIVTNVMIISVTNPANSLYGLLSFPVAICLDIVTIGISTYRYEFGEIDWKGRNVCIPVMHTYPRLPDLD